jgi:hypothetical protein
MKAVLKFNLPEDRDEHQCAIKGQEYLSRLCEIDNFCRSTIKHTEISLSIESALETIRGMCGNIWTEI